METDTTVPDTPSLLEEKAMTDRLIMLGLTVYQTRMLTQNHSGFPTLFHTMSHLSVRQSMAEYRLTHVSVMLVSQLLYFMKTNKCLSFRVTNLDEFHCLHSGEPVNESVFHFFQQLDLTAVDIAALNYEHNITKEKDLVNLLLAGRNCEFLGPAEETLISPRTTVRLKWALEHAILQQHSPRGDMRDIPFQERDLFGDFDYKRAIDHDALKFYDSIGVSRYQSHAMMKGLPVFAGEADCLYDRMVTVALDVDSLSSHLGSTAHTEKEDWPPQPMHVQDSSAESALKAELAEWVVSSPEDRQAYEKRSKLIRKHLLPITRARVFKLVCYMETQMHNITPRVYRLACFHHEVFKQWEKTVDWAMEKTYFPRKYKYLVPPKYVNGRVMYLDGSTDNLLVRAQIRYDCGPTNPSSNRKRSVDSNDGSCSLSKSPQDQDA